MNFKKRVNGSWTDTSHYIHNTSTDIITTLPAVIYPTGTTATVGLKGQTTQSSIPSSTSPVMPQGTGERTGNLCPDTPYKTGYSINANGVETNSPQFSIYCIPAEPETEYALSLKEPIGGTTVRVHAYKNGEWQAQLKTSPIQDLPLKFTTITNCDELRLSIVTIAVPMLNLGSTALPYEPYGYKIPISSNSTTTNVYLGEVQTTRNVKKLVFDGTENWAINQSGTANAYFSMSTGLRVKSSTQQICTHFVWGDVSSSSTTKGIYMTQSGVVRVRENEPSASDLTSFESFLQQQYAAGTPVTIWYVLATEETAVVNEPLMKIGDYADEVSGITIPTIAGANTLDVHTTVKPSEVTASFNGWHPVSSAHERSGGAWD